MESLSMQLQPFFEWLLRTTLQASLLICLILLFQAVLRSRLGARWHYCLWLLLLIRMAMPWAPQSRLSVFNLIPQRQTEYARQEVGDDSADSDVADKSTAESTPVSTTEVVQDTSKAITATPQIGKEAQGRLKPVVSEVANILPLIWLAGALILAVYVCASNFNLLRIVKRERPLTDQKILDLLEDCKAEMGIRIILGVVATDKVKSPALFGFIRPRLLLPKGMLETLSREELRYVFLHELAHLKRHDIYLGYLSSLLQVLHWFNPLIWLAFYRIRTDRELACDALVLARTESGRAKDYGRTIVNLLERFSRSQRLPAMAGILETKAQLKRRITMIARFKKNSYQWSPLAVALIIVLGCISLLDARRTKASGISAAKPEAVSSTNSRLATPGPAGDAQQTGLVIRELNIEYWTGGLSLSRDGSKLVYCGRKHGKNNLVVHDLISGEETEITDYVNGHAWNPVFSPDGKEIAYTHWQVRRSRDLHIVSPGTGEDRCLDHKGFVRDWSRDGRFILLLNGQILSVNGGTVEKVNLSLPAGPDHLRFSPDAKYVSYSHKGNLYLYPVDGGDAIQITWGSNGDSQPIWSPDGKMLLFRSRRAFEPELDLCVLPIVDAKASSDVRVIRPDFCNNVKLISLSDTGRLLYEQSYMDEHIFLTAIDPQTGQPTGEPVKLASGSHPVWSPDGKRIAYLADGLLHVMSADGSNDQEIISVGFRLPDTYGWAPDSDTIYIQEFREGKRGIYAISISTKERRPVFLDSNIEGHLTCSPDGKRLAFIGYPPSSRKQQVFIVDVDGKNLRQLTSYEDGFVWYPAWSPDGKEIAFEYGTGGDIKTITVVSVDDGTTREVFRGNTPKDRFFRKSWSPDGSKIAWGSGGELRIGQVSNGKYHTFKVDIDEPWLPGWSPDGTKMLFCTWVNVEQLMIMDNFLPQADEAK